MELRLRPLRPEDSAEALIAHQELSDEGHSFLLGFDRAAGWDAYLAALEAELRGATPRRVVASTYLVATVGGRIAGRCSIRHRLSPELERYGGHIGYVVRPADRGRGVATEILRQSLIVARSLGVARALLTCDEDNRPSIAVIERCGGVLEDRIEGPVAGHQTRRYWID